MTFFRVKRIKGKEYAYIVDNEWKRKGSRQKVKAYLGRAYKFSLMNDVDFLKYLNIENAQHYVEANGKDKIISDLVEWELHKFKISREEFFIDVSNSRIQKNNKNVVLLINDGFLCSHTLEKLLGFKAQGSETDGYYLARAFVEAGIKIPREIFIGLFGKLDKQ